MLFILFILYIFYLTTAGWRPCYVVEINSLTVIMLVSVTTARTNQHSKTREEMLNNFFTFSSASGNNTYLFIFLKIESSQRPWLTLTVGNLFFFIKLVFLSSIIICQVSELLCVYHWVHSPPAPCAACRPCGKPQGWCGCTEPREEGQTCWSLCCRYLYCPRKPAAHEHRKLDE